MFEQLNSQDSLTESDKSIFFEIIEEFKLENRYYLIIKLDISLEFKKLNPQSLYFSTLNPEWQYISRFNVNGQLCAIVEAEAEVTFAQPEPDLITLLTQREMQIATLIALGRVNKQIAHQLHISEWTVSTYLRRIFAKLGVESRAAMVYRCASLIQQLRDLETPKTGSSLKK